MKLRIQGNSIRLRLSESEVRQFYGADDLSDEISFGLQQKLVFQLLKSDQSDQIHANFLDHRIQIYIPKLMAKSWTQSDLVGLENYQDLPGGQQLKILIEKDFPCVHKTEEKQAFRNIKS